MENKRNSNGKSSYQKKSFSAEKPSEKSTNRKFVSNSKSSTYKKENDFDNPQRKKSDFNKKENFSSKKASFSNEKSSSFKKPFKKEFSDKFTGKKFEKSDKFYHKKSEKFSDDDFQIEEKNNANGEIRLNRFIANAGICSRRNADIYIKAGNVQINGVVMATVGYRVKPTDEVKFDGKVISSEKKEYILLNKPKGFITTTSDEKGRKTVMDLVANATSARILPVGRLDRPTTGLLLLTNDGDLAKKLTHPTHGVRKIYHVVLNKKLDYKDFIKIEEGITLEDGFIQVDEISYVNDKPKNEIGVKIHSGKNRIVRRIFEHLGYEIEKLDRVVFAGLTKKDLPRGHWRRLTQQEIINLKNIK